MLLSLTLLLGLVDKDGNTALIMAARGGKIGACTVLADRGANLNLGDKVRMHTHALAVCFQLLLLQIASQYSC